MLPSAASGVLLRLEPCCDRQLVWLNVQGGLRAMAHTMGAQAANCRSAAHAVMGRLYAHMFVLFSLKDQVRGDA